MMGGLKNAVVSYLRIWQEMYMKAQVIIDAPTQAAFSLVAHRGHREHRVIVINLTDLPSYAVHVCARQTLCGLCALCVI
jgi:hypothetical protein